MKRSRDLIGTILGFLVIASFVPAKAQTTSQVNISTHSGTGLEERGKQQLERLLQTWPLDPWIFTHDVVIQSRVIPHSHPVLTLNTRSVEDDVQQLSSFLHEQIHWYADADSADVEHAMNEFRERWPEVPVGDGQGARSEYSTYLHLVVCWLEFDAMSTLIGEETTRELLGNQNHYTWIYEQVLANTNWMGDVLERNGVRIESERAGPGIEPHLSARLGTRRYIYGHDSDAALQPYVELGLSSGSLGPEGAAVHVEVQLHVGRWWGGHSDTDQCRDCFEYAYSAWSVGSRLSVGLNHFPLPLALVGGVSRHRVFSKYVGGLGIGGNTGSNVTEYRTMFEYGARMLWPVTERIRLGVDAMHANRLGDKNASMTRAWEIGLSGSFRF